MASRIVVAGAVVRQAADGARLLMAQRSYPADLAGLWELPGGKAEPGESDEQALVRELHEELGIVVAPGESVGADVALGDDLVLRAYRADWVSGEPTALEHRAVAWLSAEEVRRLAADGAIVPADAGWVPELTALLRLRGPS
ncbi:(deoxy)nucleoside triphosphate pyrophosphohydrolase [Gordonia sp. (in: high G+C Gram-positive bacteria)]|uniref:(deoxy)nucleoside triphosphate pyrophosphohydrolase n=1 Tax=Gordonia sp. (in: high G+C Gram-positive bacteria) TaxID=84139 RepID=UPI0039E2DB0D